MENPLIIKYRPQDFNQVCGNRIAIEALASNYKGAHTFLFTGPPGLGKTTLARIVAKNIGAVMHEWNAAMNSGVDDTREIVAMTGFKPLNAKAVMIIIDECQNLSEKGWQPFLKPTEEPPSYVYFSFCTTEPQKVPKAIVSRSYHVKLAPLKMNEMEEFLQVIAELEGWSVDNDVFSAMLQASEGSPRKALSILLAGHGAKNREELAQIVAAVEVENEPVVELCKLLIAGNTNWKRLTTAVSKIENWDQASVEIGRYISAAMLRSEEGQAQQCWKILEALTTQNGWDKKTQIACLLGRTLWGHQVF